MRNTFMLATAALALGACTTVPGATGGMYQPRVLGADLYSMSEMDMPFGGDVLTMAARFCNQRGGQLRLQGNAQHTGSFSGTRYERIVFSCGGV